MYCLSEEKGNNKVQGDEGGGGGALGLKVLGVYTSTFSHSLKTTVWLLSQDTFLSPVQAGLRRKSILPG